MNEQSGVRAYTFLMPLDMGRAQGAGGAVIFVLSLLGVAAILCAVLILRDRRVYPRLYAVRENAPEQNGIRS